MSQSSHHQYSRPCRSHYQHSVEVLRPPRLDHHQPGVSFYLEVLVITMLFLWHQAETLHRLPSTDRRSDQKQNSMIEAYLQAFVNFEQNDWAWFLPMMEFAYNNAKNASTGHISFKFNCGYHPRVFYKEDLDPRSK